MADELIAPDTLTAEPPVGSLAFRHADAFTAKAEGGVTRDDGTGHAAAYGIDQAAHPNIDVLSLTPRKAQEIRYGYWTAIGGDQIAQQNPQLALMTYDTAIMAGPERAKQLLAQSNGDPSLFMQLRSNFLQSLARSDPQRYGRVAQGWAMRDQALARSSSVYHPQIGYGASDYDSTLLTPYTLPPRQPRNFLESVNDAVAEANQPKQDQPQAAPQPSPLASIAVQPAGLPQQPVRQPAPVQIPRPIDYYQALLSHRTLEPSSG